MCGSGFCLRRFLISYGADRLTDSMEKAFFVDPMESARTKCILQTLADLPNFGLAILNEMVSRHVTNEEELRCQPLTERVALRNLEEMVVNNQIDSDAIPLLEQLSGQDLGPRATVSSSGKQWYQKCQKALVLRLRTEVVLSVLREDVDEGQKDWAFYEAELERVFKGAEKDNLLLDRKRELIALLKPKNQTKANVAAFLKKYSLSKLRDDLLSFIYEKRESCGPLFLKKVIRDTDDANGKLFTEDVDKPTHVESNGKQDQMRQNPMVNEIGDQHIVLETATISGKKRGRRKLLPTQDGIGNDESDEAEEDSAKIKKSRTMHSASIVKPSLRQEVSELVVLASGQQNGRISVNPEVESGKQLSLLNRGGKHVSDLRSLKMRSCSPVAQKSISMKRAKTSPREPSRINKYVVTSDVDSDAETQVVEVLSSDDENSVKGDGDMLKIKGNLSLCENGSDRERPQNIVKAEVRKENFVVQSEQMILPDRKEACMVSPEVKSSPREDHGKFVTKNKFKPPDSQEISAVNFLEVGSNGREEFCQICGGGGKLLCCKECSSSMHFTCVDGLGIEIPKNKESWYCPHCMSLRTAREAEEVEKMLAVTSKANAVAKKNLKAFQMKSQKRRSSCEGNSNGQEKAGKQSKLTTNSLEFGENDRTLKARQQSADEAMQGQQDSDSNNASLQKAVLRRGLHQLNLRDSDHASPEDKRDSNRVVSLGQGADGKNVGRAVQVNEQLVTASPKSLVKNGARSMRDESAKPVSQNEDEMRIPHKAQPSHDREVARKVPCAASTSGDVGSLIERFARFPKRNGPEIYSDEEDSVKAGPGVPESASRPGSRREREDEKDDEELDEDCSEDRTQAALSSGRRRIPGLRRKNLPWTRQEEQTLKEGVKRFSINGTHGFQWKRILDFGRGRFDPTRTDVDLKDKWRNLVRAVS